MSGTPPSHADQLRPYFSGIGQSAQITSPQTPKYNCIAYAAGDHKRWWWPDSFGYSYWPPSAPRLETLPAFQFAFESLGYELCADDDYSDHLEKIAIFQKENKPSHAAKLIGQGIWSSKLGQNYDISHTKHCLDGDGYHEYGAIAFFMARPLA